VVEPYLVARRATCAMVRQQVFAILGVEDDPRRTILSK
jgi:hypothetical protein